MPPLHRRVAGVFLAPGELFRVLREQPRILAALLLGAAVVALAQGLIPTELWEAAIREQMLEAGRADAADGVNADILRIGSVVGALLSWFVLSAVAAGGVTLAFAFILGDEGRYTQYYAVLAHAWLIPALGTLLVTPLRIVQDDPRLLLSVGLFFPFFESGYPARFLGLIDLFGLWGWIVAAVGVHEIDPRRGWGSAAAILVSVFLGFTALIAVFAPG